MYICVQVTVTISLWLACLIISIYQIKACFIIFFILSLCCYVFNHLVITNKHVIMMNLVFLNIHKTIFTLFNVNTLIFEFHIRSIIKFWFYFHFLHNYIVYILPSLFLEEQTKFYSI